VEVAKTSADICEALANTVKGYIAAIVEVAKALGGSFKLVTPAPKTCKGDDSTAQGNTKGWGHTNKLKQYKHKIQTLAK